MSIPYSQMELSVPQSVINDDYKLSLKHFINKDFYKSYALITKLHDCCYRNFERNIISEQLFIKIVNLYLTQVGMLFYPPEAEKRFQLPVPQKKELTERIRQNEFWNRLEEFYGNANEVPAALLYQVFLLNYACNKETNSTGQEALIDQFNKVYSTINFHVKSEADSEYLKRFSELYIFKALPDIGEFDSALKLSEENPLLDPEQAKERLTNIRQAQIQMKDTLKREAEDRARKEKTEQILEAENQEKEKKEANLRYRSLKHIKQAREQELVGNNNQQASSHNSATVKALDEWILKAKFLLKLSNSFIQKNYLTLLVALVITLISRRFARARNLNLLEKFRETVRMAFKVTYL